MTPLCWLLAALASARTFRLFAVDGIGDPVRNRFNALVTKLGEHGGRRLKLAVSLREGAYCTACFPFWITLAWVGSGLAWSDTLAWQLLAGGLGLSYVVSHVLATLEGDDVDDAE